jgi:molybdopterin biosynthesis enzyme
VLRDVRAAAQECSLPALGVLAEILHDREQSATARIAAANSILDRAYGKPRAARSDECEVSPDDRDALRRQVDDACQATDAVLRPTVD